MGAAKDDFIGDAHDDLRDVDEKMPGHGEVVRHGLGEADWNYLKGIEARKRRKPSMTRTAKGAFRRVPQGYDAFSLLSP